MSVANGNDVHIVDLQWWWWLIAWGALGAVGLALDVVDKVRARRRTANSRPFVYSEWYESRMGITNPDRPASTRQGGYEVADTPPSSKSVGRDDFKWWLEVVGIIVAIVAAIVQTFGN